MKICVPSKYEKERDESIEQYTERLLDSGGHDTDMIDDIGCSTRKNASAIGRLLELLATKGMLTASEVTRIVDGYANAGANFK